MVWRLVRVPPSHRWLTKNCPVTSAASLHCLLRLFLRSDEENLAATLDELTKIRSRPGELLNGDGEIDDVDRVLLFENEIPHLGIPALRLVAVMHPGFKEFSHNFKIWRGHG